jgi:PAS domain S-box-containing protein
MSREVLDTHGFGNREDAAEFISNVLESSTEYSMIATDRDGVLQLWNEGAVRLYGYSPAEMIGRSSLVLHTDEDTRSGLPQEMTECALRERKWEGDVAGVRKDGSRSTARVVMTPLHRDDGDPSGFLVISRDITEEGLLALAATRDVHERERFARQLRNANAKLEAADRAKDRFLANMSHELRTPLNAVLGFTGTLLMGRSGPLNDEQTKHMRTVQVNGKHLFSLINDLLDLARIESGKIELHIEKIDCQGLLDEVAAWLRPLTEEKGIALEVISPLQPVELSADRRALNQILINLANNAIKFTEQGGVRLELSQSGSDDARLTRFSVTDTGCGIRPSDQTALFEAFEQIVAAGRAYEGTGLGLYICHALSIAMGAAITSESEFGQGSTFTLELKS